MVGSAVGVGWVTNLLTLTLPAGFPEYGTAGSVRVGCWVTNSWTLTLPAGARGAARSRQFGWRVVDSVLFMWLWGIQLLGLVAISICKLSCILVSLHLYQPLLLRIG